jgi:hypothetical protein
VKPPYQVAALNSFYRLATKINLNDYFPIGVARVKILDLFGRCLRVSCAMLILKSASKFRPSGEWSADDYDVFESDRHVGRIMRSPQAPQGEPWFWTITARRPQSTADRGNEATRELAMTAFKAAWARKA